MGVGVVHPHLQLLPGGGAAGGVVGGADVDEVGHPPLRQAGEEAVLRRAGQVDQIGPLLPVVVPRPAGHGVGVHIHRVHRVAHRHHVVHREDVPDVAAVALGAVGHKDLFVRDLDAPGQIGVPDGEAQEIVGPAGLLTVAPEGLLVPHLLRGFVERLHHHRGQGQRHVPDAQADEGHRGALRREGPDPPADLREEIAAGELGKILIDMSHR